MFIGPIHSRRPVRRVGRLAIVDRGLRKQRSPTGEVGSWRAATDGGQSSAARRAAGTYAIPARATIAARARAAPAPEQAVGSIDWQMLDGAGMLDPRDPATALGAIFEEIGAPLLERARASDAHAADRVVLITSPGHGDGKTFTALNLALCLARDPDRTVLLIDAAPSRPGALALLTVEPPRGLSDLLGEAGASPGRTIVQTELRGLAVLGPGAPRADLADLLASPRMSSVLRALCERDPRRMIIIDGPSLSAGREAGILADLAGQTLLVADGGTPAEAIDAALEKLNGGRPIFLLRNRVAEAGR